MSDKPASFKPLPPPKPPRPERIPCNHNPEHILSIEDVDKMFHEGMNALDHAWPDGETPPAKFNVVELIDSIRFRLHQTAERNMHQGESAFERAAKRITGVAAQERAAAEVKKYEDSFLSPTVGGKSEAQLQHEAAQARIRR